MIVPFEWTDPLVLDERIVDINRAQARQIADAIGRMSTLHGIESGRKWATNRVQVGPKHWVVIYNPSYAWWLGMNTMFGAGVALHIERTNASLSSDGLRPYWVAKILDLARSGRE